MSQSKREEKQACLNRKVCIRMNCWSILKKRRTGSRWDRWVVRESIERKKISYELMIDQMINLPIHSCQNWSSDFLSCWLFKIDRLWLLLSWSSFFFLCEKNTGFLYSFNHSSRSLEKNRERERREKHPFFSFLIISHERLPCSMESVSNLFSSC